ncbi:MAG TPA: TetR family transcriptional regulator [Euzebyales bacterium]|nr:TetR family transcriptional regulator [Euzebyales bacterium]
MSSIYGTSERPQEDLTARARIRDAAMAQFADIGFKDTTIKRIADAAGVSTGLVQHHFGTKDGLRQACDEAVAEVITRQIALIDDVDSAVANPDFASALYARSPLLVRYLIRLMIEGSPVAAALFDQMAAGTERFLSESRPDIFPPGSQKTRDGATIMSVMHLGAAALHQQVSRRMDVDVWDPATAPRLGLVMLDVYLTMADWITSDTGIQARAAVAAYLDGLPSPTAAHDQEHDQEHDDA